MTLKSKLIQWGIKQYFKHINGSIKKIEKRQYKLFKFDPPKKILKNLIVERITICNYPCFIIKPHSQQSNSLMYIHGGGFINEITKIHYKFIYRLIKETGATVYVPIYPLARKDFSNIEPSLTMFIEIYKIMIAKYSKISLMGDSAGGSFVLALAQMIKKQQLKIPNEVIAISPCVKACKTSIDETKKYANNDAYLPWPCLYIALEWTIGFNDWKHYKFSPIYGNSKDIGRISIFYGSHEAFLKDGEEYHQDLLKQDIKHIFEVCQDMFHVFVLFKIKEAEPYFAQICKLIK